MVRCVRQCLHPTRNGRGPSGGGATRGAERQVMRVPMTGRRHEHVHTRAQPHRNCEGLRPSLRTCLNAQFLQRSSAGSVVCVIKRMPAAIHTDVGKEVREIGLEHLLITSRESTRTR